MGVQENTNKQKLQNNNEIQNENIELINILFGDNNNEITNNSDNDDNIEDDDIQQDVLVYYEEALNYWNNVGDEEYERDEEEEDILQNFRNNVVNNDNNGYIVNYGDNIDVSIMYEIDNNNRVFSNIEYNTEITMFTDNYIKLVSIIRAYNVTHNNKYCITCGAINLTPNQTAELCNDCENEMTYNYSESEHTINHKYDDDQNNIDNGDTIE